MIFKEAEARKDLKNFLSKSRYKHSLGVVNTALKLAEKHGIDLYKAEISALFHDFAKEFKDEYSLNLLKEMKNEDQFFKNNPSVAHGITGAYILKRDYYLEDEEILSAIRKHTFGSAEMSDLDRLIFVADAIEPSRDYPGVVKYRKIAKEDLYLVSILIVRDNIKYLIKKNRKIYKDSVDMYNNGVSLLSEYND